MGTNGSGGIIASAAGTGVRFSGTGGGAGRVGWSGSAAAVSPSDGVVKARSLSGTVDDVLSPDDTVSTRPVTAAKARTPPIRIHGGPPDAATGSVAA